MENRAYPCDISGICPFDATGGMDCRNCCGLGVDESEVMDYAEFEDDNY